MNTIETKKTSMTERLQVMEALWDSLLDEESEFESPEWHQDILEENKKEIRLPSDPIGFLPNNPCIR